MKDGRGLEERYKKKGNGTCRSLVAGVGEGQEKGIWKHKVRANLCQPREGTGAPQGPNDAGPAGPCRPGQGTEKGQESSKGLIQGMKHEDQKCQCESYSGMATVSGRLECREPFQELR